MNAAAKLGKTTGGRTGLDECWAVVAAEAAKLGKTTGGRTVTFQPSSGAKAILAEVMKATGKSKSAVVNEALEVAGPHLSGAYLAKKAKLAADIASALKESHDSRDGG